MSSSCLVSLSSFNLLFFTQVLTVLTTSTVKYNEYVTDKGKNISVPCDADGTIMWVKENVRDNFMAQTGRVLHLTNVSEADGGVYVCLASRPISRQPAAKPESEQSRTVDVNGNEASSLATNRTDISEDLAALSTSPLKPGRLPSTRGDDVDAASILPANKSVDDDIVVGLQVVERLKLIVRTPPGPVTQLYFKASTILGFLVWRFDNAMSGGYPVRSFTAEFRNVSYVVTPFNSSFEHEWSRMDPINIAPNVRQMEVYRLEPNTTYEFRIWANNQLGNGEVVTTNVTTLPETKEEDLIRLIQADLDNFDPRIWIVAVSIVLGTLVILAIGLCIVLSKECYQASHMGIESSDHTASSCSATITDCKLDIFMA